MKMEKEESAWLRPFVSRLYAFVRLAKLDAKISVDREQPNLREPSFSCLSYVGQRLSA